MLLGRESEQARLLAVLDRARNGAAATLVLTGEAGIGKSALLSFAVSRASGMQVLAATGFESEVDLAFAGLADLLGPVLPLLPSIPPPQAAALAGALRIGEPVPGDRFTIYAGLLSLLAAAAEQDPLLLAVDDAQWLDRDTQEAMLFAARRLQAESIAMIVVVREGAVSSFSAPIGLECLPVGGLLPGQARVLLGGQLSPAVAAELTAAAGGNPLALLELPGQLSAAQRQGLERLADPLPVGPLVRRAFARRLDEHGAATRAALLVAATSDTGDLREIAPALGVLGAALRDLEPAEEADLIVIENDTLRYCHPLLRSTVYATASAAQRRAAHAALAAGLTGPAQAHRRAWHLAEAAAAPDENVALALERTALNARLRGGPAAAATALERAARLSPGPEGRARRLREAASDWTSVGRGEHAAALLDLALLAGPSAPERARIVHAQGSLLSWSGRTREAARVLEAEARRLLPVDPRGAAIVLAEAATPLSMAGDMNAALRLALEAEQIARSSGAEVPVEVGNCVISTLVIAGRAREVEPRIEAGERALLAADPLAFGPLAAGGLAQMLVWTDEFDRARVLLDRFVAAARAASAPALLPYPLALLCQLRRGTGEWAAAAAAGHEALTLADELGQPGGSVYSRAALALLAAVQGQDHACREHVAAALAVLHTFEFESIRIFTTAAEAYLALGAGAVEEAIPHLEQLRRMTESAGLGEPGFLEWAPSLVEALARAGRFDDAQPVLAALAWHAQLGRRRSTSAALARARGILAPAEKYEVHFDLAMSVHGQLAMPFEQARTELCYGERLRRDRRPVEARRRLASALGTFERLGAMGWTARARAELSAAGGRIPRPAATPASEQLTPRELQVALTVGQGATSREAAAALFLSPRTVDFHLGNLYRKLGARSRSELVRLVATGQPPFDAVTI